MFHDLLVRRRAVCLCLFVLAATYVTVANAAPPVPVEATIVVNPGDPNFPATCAFPLEAQLSGKGGTHDELGLVVLL